MNRIPHIRRLAAALTGLAGALLAFAAIAPPALAQSFPPRPPGWDKHPPLPPRHISQVHTVVIGGMPGWQIALIAAGAALLAATVAVFLDRAWAVRRKMITAAADGHDPEYTRSDPDHPNDQRSSPSRPEAQIR